MAKARARKGRPGPSETEAPTPAPESWADLQPPLASEEAGALRGLAEVEVWEQPFRFDELGVWELERLDRRRWIQAQELDAKEGPNGEWVYTPRGPWFHPTANRRGDGRPDWPAILTGFKYANASGGRRLYARMALTAKGRGMAAHIAESSVLPPTPVEQLARALEQVAAEWRRGDEEMTIWAVGGTETGGFEKVVGEYERGHLRWLVKELREKLVPAASKSLDPALRDDLRAFVRELDPDAWCANRDGATSTRWRHTWASLNYQLRADELIAMIRAVGAEQQDGWTNACKTGAWIQSKTAKVRGGGLAQDTLRQAGKRGELVSAGRQGRAHLYRLGDVAQKWPDYSDALRAAYEQETGSRPA